MYPQKVNIKIQILPFICSDDEAVALVDLPPEIENIENVDRRRENVEGADFYEKRNSNSVCAMKNS